MSNRHRGAEAGAFRRLVRLPLAWIAAAPLLLAACHATSSPLDAPGSSRFGGSPGGATANIVVINGVADSLDVFIDGSLQPSGVSGLSISANFSAPAGSRKIELRQPGQKLGAEVVVTLSAQTQVIVAAIRVGSTVVAEVLPDDGGESIAGSSKVRVLNLSTNVPSASLWSTRPDAPTPAIVESPFLFNIILPFVQSMPGTWEFRAWDSSAVTTWGSATTAIILNVASGEVRTVVILDESSGMRFQAVPPA